MPTFSDRRKLARERLEELVERVSTVIDSHGGKITRHLLAVLFISKCV